MIYILHAADFDFDGRIDSYYYADDLDTVKGRIDGFAGPFETRRAANDAKLAAQKEDGITRSIAAWLTSQDQSTWTHRESQKFRRGEYMCAPWERNGRQTLDGIPSYHYAHISVEKPGLIAYTASLEHGVLDRQTRTTPARYLEKFAPTLSADQIADYVAQIKSYGGALQIAETPDDIEAVYRHGPYSCMSHSPSSYRSAFHPVRIYGMPGSDLRVAYLGTLDDVSARCVIWPERKVYTRIYGDTALRLILEREGYTGSLDKWTNALVGAHVPAVKDPNRTYAYVMPYIDAAESADLTPDGKRFCFTSYGSFSVRDTKGLITETEQYSCTNCGDSIEEEGLCSRCEDRAWTCDRCDETSYDLDDQVSLTYATYCPSCARYYERECVTCGETFHTHGDFSTRERRNRETSHTDRFCRDCANNCTPCAHCDTGYLGPDDGQCRVCDEPLTARELDTHTRPLPLENDTPTTSRPLRVVNAGGHCTVGQTVQISRIGDSFTVYFTNGRFVNADGVGTLSDLAHRRDFIVGRRYRVIRVDNRTCDLQLLSDAIESASEEAAF